MRHDINFYEQIPRTYPLKLVRLVNKENGIWSGGSMYDFVDDALWRKSTYYRLLRKLLFIENEQTHTGEAYDEGHKYSSRFPWVPNTAPSQGDDHSACASYDDEVSTSRQLASFNAFPTMILTSNPCA